MAVLLKRDTLRGLKLDWVRMRLLSLAAEDTLDQVVFVNFDSAC